MLIDIDTGGNFSEAQIKSALEDLLEEMGATARELRPALLKRPRTNESRIVVRTGSVSVEIPDPDGFDAEWMRTATIESDDGFFILPEEAT